MGRSLAGLCKHGEPLCAGGKGGKEQCGGCDECGGSWWSGSATDGGGGFWGCKRQESFAAIRMRWKGHWALWGRVALVLSCGHAVH